MRLEGSLQWIVSGCIVATAELFNLQCMPMMIYGNNMAKKNVVVYVVPILVYWKSKQTITLEVPV